MQWLRSSGHSGSWDRISLEFTLTDMSPRIYPVKKLHPASTACSGDLVYLADMQRLTVNLGLGAVSGHALECSRILAAKWSAATPVVTIARRRVVGVQVHALLANWTQDQ